MIIETPLWIVVALLAAAGLAWIALKNGWGRQRAAMAGVAALLCGVAPAGVAMRSAAGPVRVVVIDDSGSMQASATSVAVRLAPQLLAGGARVGIVRFAEIATVARNPSTAPLEFTAEPDRTANRTDVAAALRRAAELLPSTGGEVVVFTDGRVPGAMSAAIAAAGRRLRASGGRLSFVPAGPPAGHDAAAWSLRGPSVAAAGSPVRLHCTVKLSAEGAAHIAITRDDTEIHREQLRGTPGELRRLVVDDSPSTAAGETIRYRLRASAGAGAGAPDAVTPNGSRELLISVGGERVVWMCSERPLRPGITTLAQSTGVRLVAKQPADLPRTSGELAGVSAIIVGDGRRKSFPPGTLEAIADYVARGGGLLQLGGPNSYGLAGFGGDALERVSAVKSDPRTERPLALAIVLDASGSMAEPVAPGDPGSGAKIDAARAAIEAALEQLRPADRLYIVPFREGALTPVELGAGATAAGAATLRDALIARGGTHVRPAVEAAARWLQSAGEPARQLVIVSDGRDSRLNAGGADRAAVETLLGELRADEIGTSLLSSASELGLSSMVEAAGGRVAFLVRFSSVEELLGRELRLSRGSLEWSGDGAPAPLTPLEAIPLPAQLPRIRRANRTTLNPGAVGLLQLPGDEPAPLLAVREVGHGRTAAFTSVPAQGWAPGWAGGEGATLLAAALNYVLAGDRTRDLALRATARAGDVSVAARWIGPAPSDGRRLDLVDGERRAPFVPSGPGAYRATVPLTPEARLVRVVEHTDAGERPGGALALPGGWAAEWNGTGVDLDGCDRLASLAGGTAVADAVLWRPYPLPGEAPRPIGGWLLAAGLLAVLALFGRRRR